MLMNYMLYANMITKCLQKFVWEEGGGCGEGGRGGGVKEIPIYFGQG